MNIYVANLSFDIQDEEFSLANIFDRSVAQPGERVLNGLSLGIEYRALRHDPNVCFHWLSITLAATRESARGEGNHCWKTRQNGLRIPGLFKGELFVFREKCVFETHVH